MSMIGEMLISSVLDAPGCLVPLRAQTSRARMQIWKVRPVFNFVLYSCCRWNSFDIRRGFHGSIDDLVGDGVELPDHGVDDAACAAGLTFNRYALNLWLFMNGATCL